MSTRPQTLPQEPNDGPRCFQIVRIFYPGLDRRNRIIRKNLTEKQAQTHCSQPHTSKAGVYFDGYDYMKGCRP